VNADSDCSSATSRDDATFLGNEDETEFGLHNYLGLAVHDARRHGRRNVCVLTIPRALHLTNSAPN